MPKLLNQRHEIFAQSIASGMKAVDAYRSLPWAKAKPGSSEREVASRLLAKVGPRVAELQAGSATATTLTMQERREIAAEIARNPEEAATVRLTAIMNDAKLAGELIEKVDMTMDDKRVLTPQRRAELLRQSIERRTATHGRC